MQTAYRVAAVQAEPVWLDAAATGEKTIGLIEDAAAQGVALLASSPARSCRVSRPASCARTWTVPCWRTGSSP